jgi:hypothetical protein
MILANSAQPLLPPLRALCALCVKTHIQPRQGVSLRFAANASRMNTSAKRTLNPCRMNTSKTQHLKSFRMNTSKKPGGGGDPHLVHTIPEARPLSQRASRRGTSPRSHCHLVPTSLRPSSLQRTSPLSQCKKKEAPSSRRTPLPVSGGGKLSYLGAVPGCVLALCFLL